MWFWRIAKGVTFTLNAATLNLLIIVSLLEKKMLQEDWRYLYWLKIDEGLLLRMVITKIEQ